MNGNNSKEVTDIEGSKPNTPDTVRSERSTTELQFVSETVEVPSASSHESSPSKNGNKVEDGCDNEVITERIEAVSVKEKGEENLEGNSEGENSLEEVESQSDRTDNETSDDGEEDEEEDEPPLLKYSRIKQLPTRFFQRDTISACYFGDDVFIFGTHSGLVYFTTPSFKELATIKCHRSSVLSIYSDGTVFATASIDGTVVIGPIKDVKSAELTAFDFKRPVSSVVLSDNYATSRSFISGGMAGEVILSQRNWLGNRVDSILSKGHGPVLGIFKVEDLLIWFNDTGINFYDIPSKKLLLGVPFEEKKHAMSGKHTDDELRLGLFKPHLHSPERDRLIIGWAHKVWYFKITPLKRGTDDSFGPGNIGSILSSAASSLRVIPDKEVELENCISVPMLIAGLSSFKDDQLLCLGYEKCYNSNNELILKGLPPQLKIFSMANGTEIYNDEIVSKNYDRLSLNDYHLGKYVEKNGENPVTYILISSSDAINIQQLTLKDHYNWFLDGKRYFDAWKVGRYVVSDYENLQTGIKYIEKLIDSNDWDAVGEMTDRICSPILEEKSGAPEDDTSEDGRSDKMIAQLAANQWNYVVQKAIESGKLDYIVNYLPHTPKLGKPLYSSILVDFLENENKKSLSKYLKIWALELYDVDMVIKKMQTLRKVSDESFFYTDQIIFLYLKRGQLSKALPYLIEKNDQRIFDILSSDPQLLSDVTDQLMSIILIPYASDEKFHDKEVNKLSIPDIENLFWNSIELLVNNRQTITPSDIIRRFEDYKQTTNQNVDKLLLCILRKIDMVDPVSVRNCENKLIDLMSEFDQSSLLGFLQRKNNFDVERAIQICSSHANLYNELIYLWGRIGESKKALSIIIDELNDPSLAIEFVKSWGDKELWDFLIEYTTNKDNFVHELLNSYNELGGKYVEIIGGLDGRMAIKDYSSPIQDALMEASKNYQVNKNILQIVSDDTNGYAVKLLEMVNRGKLVYPDKLAE